MKDNPVDCIANRHYYYYFYKFTMEEHCTYMYFRNPMSNSSLMVLETKSQSYNVREGYFMMGVQGRAEFKVNNCL